MMWEVTCPCGDSRTFDSPDEVRDFIDEHVFGHNKDTGNEEER